MGVTVTHKNLPKKNLFFCHKEGPDVVVALKKKKKEKKEEKIM